MIIIIGLGNSGIKYNNTRHNIGFKVIDQFAEKKNFPEFKLSKKFNSLISQYNLNNKKIVLAKPQTFMNESGKAVKSLTNFYKTKKTELIVIHDDIDLPTEKIKISKDRGSAGHKGIESIISEIGNKNFIRFRIGIQSHKKINTTEKFVLQKFTKQEINILKNITKKTIEAIEFLITNGLEKTMNKYN
ncbi:MAG: aminoacyl-tRNA hydrolase [Candidatus Nealsonbacteria bacterium]